MSRPKGSKNKVKKNVLNYSAPAEDQPIEKKIERRGRPAGSVNVKKSIPAYYVPYEKSKTGKDGKAITYQTYKKDGEWLIDIFTNSIVTLAGYSENIGHLPDAIRFIDNELSLI